MELGLAYGWTEDLQMSNAEIWLIILGGMVVTYLYATVLHGSGTAGSPAARLQPRIDLYSSGDSCGHRAAGITDYRWANYDIRYKL